MVPNFVLLLLSRGKRTNFEFEFEAALLTFKQFLEPDVQYARKIFNKHMTRILVRQSRSAWVFNPPPRALSIYQLVIAKYKVSLLMSMHFLIVLIEGTSLKDHVSYFHEDLSLS